MAGLLHGFAKKGLADLLCPDQVGRVKVRELPAQLQLEVHERLAANAGSSLIGADLAERLRISQVHGGGGMAPGVIVKYVLEIEADLQVEPFFDRDVLLCRALRVQQTGSGHSVTAGIARRERVRIAGSELSFATSLPGPTVGT